MFTISVYVIIDGFFISNFVDSTAFAAVNLVFPVIMIFTSFGMMLATGSSAIIAKKLGEKHPNTLISEIKSDFLSDFITVAPASTAIATNKADANTPVLNEGIKSVST